MSSDFRNGGAVIFDLDGVLIESERLWEDVRRNFVRANGGRWRSDSHEHMMGMSTQAWAAYVSRDLGVRLPQAEVASRVIAELEMEYLRRVPLARGAIQTLRNLGSRWLLAIASGSPLSLIEAALRGAGIRELVQVVVSSDEVRAGKPAPEVFLAAVARLNVPAGNCVIVEDSTNGITAAVASGAIVVAIPNAHYPPNRACLALVDTVLPNIASLTPKVVSELLTRARRVGR